jgi:hypothetical protein
VLHQENLVKYEKKQLYKMQNTLQGLNIKIIGTARIAAKLLMDVASMWIDNATKSRIGCKLCS